jgi:hypothetical protein
VFFLILPQFSMPSLPPQLPLTLFPPSILWLIVVFLFVVFPLFEHYTHSIYSTTYRYLSHFARVWSLSGIVCNWKLTTSVHKILKHSFNHLMNFFKEIQRSIKSKAEYYIWARKMWFWTHKQSLSSVFTNIWYQT